MATANLNLPDGSKVKIEGSPEEISRILDLYSGGTGETNAVVRKTRKRKPAKTSSKTRSTVGVSRYVRELKQEDFFTTKRSLSDIQVKLEENGHIYPLTHLSTPLRRLVRAKELRRMKDKGVWVYVNN